MTGEHRFDEIAIVSTEKKKPTEEDKANYVGLEHLSPDTFEVLEYGSDVAPKGEKLVMRKGDVLFGKRRAYQKKVGIAPCDGIFSAHGMVLRPNEDVVDSRFFPFFIKSDCFLDEAIRISVGSLSPTVNWRDLRELRFRLPLLERQHELAELLWAGEDLKSTYRQLLSACDEQVKSRFVEMFGDLREDSSVFPRVRLDEVASTRLGKMLDAKKQTGKYLHPYLGNHNVQWFSFDFSELAQMDFDEADQVEFGLRYGDLLMCEGGEVGRCAIWRNELDDCFFQKAIHRIRCDQEIVLPEYLAWHFKLAADYGLLVRHTNTATIAHLSGVKLKALKILVPPVDLQEQFVSFVAQVDKSEYQGLKARIKKDGVSNSLVCDNRR